ncbi:MAG: RNA-binding protein [bacterium]
MNIYVGNLDRKTTEEELKAEFEAFGPVSSVAIIKDKITGEARGFGFVEMPDKAQSEAAIAGLNGKAVGGRNITVNEAKPKTEGGGGGRKFGGGGGRGGNRGGSGGGGNRW